MPGLWPADRAAGRPQLGCPARPWRRVITTAVMTLAMAALSTAAPQRPHRTARQGRPLVILPGPLPPGKSLSRPLSAVRREPGPLLAKAGRRSACLAALQVCWSASRRHAPGRNRLVSAGL